jgi:hypothetical protein
MKADWPSLSDYSATVGRLATAEDTRANRAVFILQSNGERIGSPIDMVLPCYAWFIDKETDDRKRCIILQAEEADQKRYYRAWLIDDKQQIMGFESDFEVVTE